MSDVTDVVNDDLEAFEKVFFGDEEQEVQTPAAEAEEVEVEEDTPQEEPSLEGDPEAEVEETDDEEDEPKKKNRKSFQERINELTRARADAERRELDTLRKLQELEGRVSKSEKPQEQATVVKTEKLPPDPDAMKDGEPAYPLGEFDPAYIRDLTRFTIAQENEAAAAYRREEEQKRAVEQARSQVQTIWNDKLNDAEKDEPELREKIVNLTGMFNGIEPQYGQYLVDVVMSLENGPRVLAYLSDNPESAATIVRSGAAGATIALGRLDARLSRPAKDEVKKVTTKAPTPPATSRGTGGQFSVQDDTDDLDAFEKKFFTASPKRRR